MNDFIKTPFGFKLSAQKFTHGLVAAKARRKITEFLEPIPANVLIYLVTNNKDIKPYLPPELQSKLEGGIALPQQILDSFSDDDVYGWFPPEYQAFFEKLPDGKAWVYRHISMLRSLIVAT
jgi:hypothetical protein